MGVPVDAGALKFQAPTDKRKGETKSLGKPINREILRIVPIVFDISDRLIAQSRLFGQLSLCPIALKSEPPHPGANGLFECGGHEDSWDDRLHAPPSMVGCRPAQCNLWGRRRK